MKSLMELLNMVKNMEIIQKGKAKTIKHAPFKGNNKKFADLLESVKRDFNVGKKNNILRDSKLQKVEIPKEMIVDLLDRVTSEEGKAEGIDAFKKDENHRSEERKTDEKSQKTVDKRSESVSKGPSKGPSVGKTKKGENVSLHKTSFVKKESHTILDKNARQNDAEKGTLNLAKSENKRDNEHSVETRKYGKIQPNECQKIPHVLKTHKSKNEVKEKETVPKKVVDASSKRKRETETDPGIKEKASCDVLGINQDKGVKDREKENQGKGQQKIRNKVMEPGIEKYPVTKQEKPHRKNVSSELRMKLPEYRENRDSRNQKITIVESKNEKEIEETQKLSINEHGKVPLKDPVETKEFRSVTHQKTINANKSIIKRHFGKSPEKLKKTEITDRKEKSLESSHDEPMVFKEKSVNERKDNAHVKKIKDDARKTSVIEGKKRPVNELKDVEIGNHESLNAGTGGKPVENVPVSEKLVKRSRKIVSHNEEMVEKVIEVVREDGTGYVKEVVIEKSVMNKEPHYKIEETIQNRRNQAHHEEQPYNIKEATTKVSLKNESFFKRLNVEAIKMETSSSKDHHVEIERNISLKQSSERIEGDKEIERAKDIIIKHTAQKKYTNEKEVSAVDLKTQNLSKTRYISGIKMDIGEDRKITLESVIEKVKEMAQKRIEKAFVQLEPPKLGRMEIEILKDGDGLRITLKVSTNEAKEILEKGSKYLVTRLENLGFRIEDIQIKENSEESHDEEGERQNGEDDYRENREGENKRRKFREIFKRKVNKE